MKKFLIGLFVLVLFMIATLKAQEVKQLSLDISTLEQVDFTKTKAGPTDHMVYDYLDTYHSKTWPNPAENFTIKSYYYAGDINGDNIDDMYYYAGFCGDERTGDVFDEVEKTIIVYGGANLTILETELFYLEIVPVGDLNGDGYGDAIGKNEDGSIQYYWGSDVGLTEDPTLYSVASLNDVIDAFFDIDNDGYEDYLTESATGDFEIVYGGSTPAAFDTIVYDPDFYTRNSYADYIKVEDIDGTGKRMIVFNADPNTWPREYNFFLIHYNSADRTISLEQSHPTQYFLNVDVADIDGDNFKEVIYSTEEMSNDSAASNHTYIYDDDATNVYTDSIRIYETKVNCIGDINDDNMADFYFTDTELETYHIAYGKADLSGGLTKDALLVFSDMTSGQYTSNYSDIRFFPDITGEGSGDFILSVENDTDFGHRFFKGGTELTYQDRLYDKVLNTGSELFQTINLGDLNGDDFDDAGFISKYDAYLQLFLSGDLTTPDYIINETDNMGINLVQSGDFNGDGFSDIAMLRKNADDYSLHQVEFYLGGSTFDIVPDHTISFVADLSLSNIGWDGFGVKTIGDINGDGKDDFFLYGQGQLFIFYGASSLPSTADHTISENDFFGARTVAAGDMNGDGLDDFAATGNNTTGIFVYFGKGMDAAVDAYSAPDLTLNADETLGYYRDFGFNVTGGDFNGDGLADIAATPYDFREENGMGDGIEGLYIFYGGTAMDNIPDKKLKIPAWPFDVDVVNYIHQLAGEITAIPDMNGDDCNEIYIPGSWWERSLDNSGSQLMKHGIIVFGGDYLQLDSIPIIQTYNAYKYNGAYNAYYYTDAHSAVGDFDHDGVQEILSMNNIPNYIGTTVYKYSIEAVNEKPGDLTLRNGFAPEDIISGARVDTFDVTDPDGNNQHSLVFVNKGENDNSAFTLEGNVLKAKENFDFETQSSYQLYVKATDNYNASLEKAVVLEVRDLNEAPLVINKLNDQVTRELNAYTYTIPDTAIVDFDAGDQLSFTASLTDGTNLPAWLSFNSSAKTFSGTPPDMDLKSIHVVAQDLEGLTAKDTFILVVEGYDEVTEEEIVVDTTSSDDAVTVTVPEEVFEEMGLGEEVTYSASLADGSPLPDYIVFDPETLSFTITLNNNKSYKDILGSLDVIITGVDKDGYQASVGFTLEGEYLDDQLNLIPIVKLYPNPVTDMLVVELPGNNQRTRIELHTIDGKLKKTMLLESEKTILDMSSMKAGIYLLAIHKKDEVKTFRLLKE